MTFFIAPVVEGQTEVASVERLLHRIWSDLLCATTRLQVLPASRGKRDAMINSSHDELTNKIEQAYAKLAQHLGRDPTSSGMLLVLLDAELDCPKELAPVLLQRATTIQPNVNLTCVLAKRMFENWIVAGASTLAQVNGLPADLPVRDDVESGSGAGWLDTQLRKANRTRAYKKTVDAEPFIRKIALDECREKSRSFRKLCKELESRKSFLEAGGEL